MYLAHSAVLAARSEFFRAAFASAARMKTSEMSRLWGSGPLGGTIRVLYKGAIGVL